MPRQHPETASQRANPERPRTRPKGLAQFPCRGVQAVFDQGIMKRTEDDRPREHGGASRSHLQHVPQRRFLPAGRDNLKPVKSVEAAWPMETKADARSGLVCLDMVLNRAVTADGAHLERSIQAHARPAGRWPQAVDRRRQAVEQRPDFSGRYAEAPLVHAANVNHVTRSSIRGGSHCRAGRRPLQRRLGRRSGAEGRLPVDLPADFARYGKRAVKVERALRPCPEFREAFPLDF
jgi:hypothetical protein